MLCLLSDLTVYVKHDNLVVLFVNILTIKSLKINWLIYLSFFHNCFLFLQYFLLLGVLYKAFDKTNRFFVDVTLLYFRFCFFYRINRIFHVLLQKLLASVSKVWYDVFRANAYATVAELADALDSKSSG